MVFDECACSSSGKLAFVNLLSNFGDHSFKSNHAGGAEAAFGVLRMEKKMDITI